MNRPGARADAPYQLFTAFRFPWGLLPDHSFSGLHLCLQLNQRYGLIGESGNSPTLSRDHLRATTLAFVISPLGGSDGEGEANTPGFVETARHEISDMQESPARLRGVSHHLHTIWPLSPLQKGMVSCLVFSPSPLAGRWILKSVPPEHRRSPGTRHQAHVWQVTPVL